MRNCYWRYSTFKKSLSGENKIAFQSYINYTKKECRRITEEPWYQDYIMKFTIPTDFHFYKSSWANPKGINYNLLIQLIAASHASQYKFVLPDFLEAKDLSEATIPDVEIFVKTEDGQIRSERVSKLFGVQICTLFNIYVSEQLNLFLLANQIGNNLENFPAQESMEIEIIREERLETFHSAIEEITCKILRNKMLFIALNK